MKEYVCVYATGPMVRDLTKSLIERNLAVRADIFDVFPMQLKNGRTKMGCNNSSVFILVERENLDEVMHNFTSHTLFEGSTYVYVLPVLNIAGQGISK